MTEKPMTVPMTRVEFATTPGTAPEIRGGNGYFTPTLLLWCVTDSHCMVTALGPTSRTPKPNRTEKSWALDKVPAWIEVPWNLIDAAKAAINALENGGAL